MTNHWIDIQNSDCILVMGSNPAENHPVSFKYITRAQQKGARLIHIDPRFTRTSARADLYAPLRSGTDIAVLGGLIKYILDRRLYHEAYVREYTNASFLVSEAFGFRDGRFAGFDARVRKYDRGFWGFQTDAQGVPRKDPSLTDPRSVLSLLKAHFAGYDLETVSRISGTPQDLLEAFYRTFAATGAPGRAGTILYAMGWTQHTVGTQNIRAMAIIQMLLGNIGIAGGGINALRGESNVQGSTDHCLLWHILPGYLKAPRASDRTLAEYLSRWTPATGDPQSANWWRHTPRYLVSLLKAYFGDHARKSNDFGYAWLPRADDDTTYSWLEIFDEMLQGRIEGFFAWGQNPACSGANADKTREALKQLDWMVNVNLFDNETGSFWQGPGCDPETVKTEVFLLPAAVSVEKEGSVTNSGRWMQWRYRGPEPRGESRPDGDILLALGKALQAAYREGGVFPEPVLHLNLDYETDGRFDPHQVARAINGRFLRDVTVKGKRYRAGTQVPDFTFLRDDGSTAAGNWLYCGSYTEEGNTAARRSRRDAPNGIGLYPEFAWAWPLNRRILYNRAAVDPQGRPWDAKRWVIRFDGKGDGGRYTAGRWIGDVPDGGWPPLANPDGSRREDARLPFIMRRHGYAQLFSPDLADGPFPAHYEPIESPLASNLLHAGQVQNPVAVTYATAKDRYAAPGSGYDIVCSTYRVSEHWQTGLMTRPQPWLMELQPRVFVEISEELAAEKGIENGERVRVASARGGLECTAMVTRRLRPLTIDGRKVHQAGIPWHYGWRWPDRSKDAAVRVEESANLLTPSAGDPNTRIPETKAFMIRIEKLPPREVE